MKVDDKKRASLISLVREIMDSVGTEEEIDEKIAMLKREVVHPHVSDLIFYSEKGEDLTPEEVVDEALAYQPTPL